MEPQAALSEMEEPQARDKPYLEHFCSPKQHCSVGVMAACMHPAFVLFGEKNESDSLSVLALVV
eukprot:scaffold18404_cov25-Prasinocladus_malaysianus.AAC.1